MGTFLDKCGRAGADLDVIRAYLETQAARLTGEGPPGPLETRWYDSLAAGEPDYSIYDGDEYLAEAWVCWQVFTREYLRDLALSGILDPEARTVADLGCGIGYSTGTLAMLLPEAHVTGTNTPGTKQEQVARMLIAEQGLEDRVTLAEVPPPDCDLVLASEYLEHFREPVAHLEDVLATCRPRLLAHASSFAAAAPGHFWQYQVAGAWWPGSLTGLLVEECLRDHGYERVAGLARPECWRLTGRRA